MTWRHISGEIQTQELDLAPQHCRFEIWTKQPEVLLRIFQPRGASDLLIEESYVRGRTASRTTYEEGGPHRRLDTNIAQPLRYYEKVLNQFEIPDAVLATFTSLGINPRKLGFDYRTQVEGEDWLVTMDYETGFIARIETSSGLTTSISYQVGELMDQPPEAEELCDPHFTEIYDYDLPTTLSELGLTALPEITGLRFQTVVRIEALGLTELFYATPDGGEARILRQPWSDTSAQERPACFRTELREAPEMKLSFEAPSEELLKALVAAVRPGVTFKVSSPPA
jgi:hypothetical protein